MICRLKKNTEFRLNDASNRTAVTKRQGTAAGNSNHAALEGDADKICPSNEDEATIGDQARWTSSSYGSHSVEQLHSTSESNQNLLGVREPAPESSIHRKVHTFLFPSKGNP